MKKKTYLRESLRNGTLLRWPSMPVRVYIAPMKFYSKQGQDYKYRGLVLKALTAWEKASSGKVSFVIVNTLLESQINLDWKRVERKALGHCMYNFDNANRLYGAEVQIGLTDGLIHQDYISEDEVYHTIVHEVGHALGLGHSSNDNDIMYTPHRYGVVNISEGDRLSIQWLYRLPLGASVSTIASKFSVSGGDIDEVIAKIIEKKSPSEFEQVKNSISSQKKDLLEEAANIADLKKYNIALQDIKISDDVRKYFINRNNQGN